MEVYLYKIPSGREVLCIPGKGAIFYKNGNPISFSENPDLSESLSQRYLGTPLRKSCQVPDDKIAQIVALGKTLNNARNVFKRAALELTDIVKD